MVAAVIRYLGNCYVKVPLRESAIVVFYVADKLGIISIAPELCRMVSRYGSFDFHTVSQLIEDDVF